MVELRITDHNLPGTMGTYPPSRMGQAQWGHWGVVVVHQLGPWPHRIFLWEGGFRVWEIPSAGEEPDAARIVLGLLYDDMPLEAALDRLQELYDDPAIARAAVSLVDSHL